MYIDLHYAVYFLVFGFVGCLAGRVVISLVRSWGFLPPAPLPPPLSEVEEGDWDREVALKAVIRLGLAKTGTRLVDQARAVFNWLHHGK